MFQLPPSKKIQKIHHCSSCNLNCTKCIVTYAVAPSPTKNIHCESPPQTNCTCLGILRAYLNDHNRMFNVCFLICNVKNSVTHGPRWGTYCLSPFKVHNRSVHLHNIVNCISGCRLHILSSGSLFHWRSIAIVPVYVPSPVQVRRVRSTASVRCPWSPVSEPAWIRHRDDQFRRRGNLFFQ